MPRSGRRSAYPGTDVAGITPSRRAAPASRPIHDHDVRDGVGVGSISTRTPANPINLCDFWIADRIAEAIAHRAEVKRPGT